jgi:hypothetical protein
VEFIQIGPQKASKINAIVPLEQVQTGQKKEKTTLAPDFDFEEEKASSNAFSALGKVLGRAIKEIQVKSLNDLSDVSPHFSVAVLFEAGLYHILQFLFLGPLAFLVIWPISGRTYAENLGFMPVYNATLFFF